MDTLTWEQFTRGLSVGIARLCADDVVIIGWHELGFVQVMQHDDFIALEISDNEGLPLTGRQREVLTASGWDPPGGGYGPLFHRDFDWRPDKRLFDELAELITVSLRDVIGLPSPAALDVRAFNIHGGEKFVLPFTPDEFARAESDVRLRLHDLDLHESVATYVIGKAVPSARTVAVAGMAAGHRPTYDDAGEYFLDRVLYVDGDDPHILVWSHVGPSGRIGSRLVPQHPGRGPALRAEQSSTLYVRRLLRLNRPLAAALTADPQLHERMSALLATGRDDVVRAERVAVDAAGGITVTPMRLDPVEVDVVTLRLPGPGNPVPSRW